MPRRVLWEWGNQSEERGLMEVAARGIGPIGPKGGCPGVALLTSDSTWVLLNNTRVPTWVHWGCSLGPRPGGGGVGWSCFGLRARAFSPTPNKSLMGAGAWTQHECSIVLMACGTTAFTAGPSRVPYVPVQYLYIYMQYPFPSGPARTYIYVYCSYSTRTGTVQYILKRPFAYVKYHTVAPLHLQYVQPY
jgi:hypothetical protein